MSGQHFIDVDPRELHLPGSRRDGADPTKLQRQISRFGRTTTGMPPILVQLTVDGRFLISDGVTRATRVAKLLPGTKVTAEIVGTTGRHSSMYPRVSEMLP
jgi:hypothetical protein